MIRFSAVLVVVAIGLLGGGVATSKLTLVYIAIAVSAGALIMLAIGVAFKREEIFGDWYVLAPADAGASPVFSAPGQSAPSQPISPFPGSTVAPLAQSALGPEGGLADAARGAVGGGWDRTGHDRVAQPSLGQPSTRQPAHGSAEFEVAAFSSDAAGGVTGGADGGKRQEGPDRTDFGRSAKGQPAFGQNPARNPWPEPDERSDRDQDSLPPWMAPGSGGTWSDRDRQADQVSGWQAGTPGGELSGTDTAGYGGTDTSGYGASRGSAGRPPLPGRHSKNAGADEPWSPPAQAESSSRAESPSPFASAPRRVPGATLGNGPGAPLGTWFDQPATDSSAQDRPSSPEPDAEAWPSPKAWDGKPWGGRVIEGEGAATPGNPAPGDAPEATSPPATASSSGWSGSGWTWSTPSQALTDDPAPSDGPATTGAPSDAVASADTTASSDEDWPTRYSWLTDDETDKPADSADPPSGDADEVVKNDVKPPGNREQHEASTVDVSTTTATATATDTDTDADAAQPAAQTAATTASEIPESAVVADVSASNVIDETQEAEENNETASPHAAHGSGTDHGTGTDGDAGEAGSAAETAEGVGLVTILPGVPRYHEANCILIRFMPKTDVQHLTIAAAENLGCTPCIACQSEE